ncbi:DeoR/GlpR family DNA-binding transcription regulator [Acidiphilium sp.]|uniref:DeoR/GlpR family DNA-binding transcription regulator n=1 Tax=Acidiphilium sp. TaxID=527 RepID=UPI003D08C2E7
MFKAGVPAMSDTLRQAEILRRAVNAPVLRVRDLAAEFGVHDMTIRRDFDALAEQGLMERVRGGARLRERMSEELSHQLRASRHTEAKSAIARAALSLIEPGDTIALDASTTALHLVRMLTGNGVSAIVSSLDAATTLAAAGVDFVLVGGAFHAPARSFTGVLFEDVTACLHPDKVFFSTRGFHAVLGLTDSYLPEVGAKRAMLRSGATAIALIDSSKFGRRALATIATLTEIDVVITDAMPAEADLAALEAADIRLIVAED